MRKALSVALLVMVLAGSARAGVLLGDAVPPPPTGDIHTTALQPGNMHTGAMHGTDLQPGDVPSTDGNIHTGQDAFLQFVLNLLALS